MTASLVEMEQRVLHKLIEAKRDLAEAKVTRSFITTASITEYTQRVAEAAQ